MKEKTQYLMETGQVSGRIRLIRGLRDSSVTASVFRCVALTPGSDPGAHKSARDLHKGGMNPNAIKITYLMSRTRNLRCPKSFKAGSVRLTDTEVLSVGGSPRNFVLNDTGCRHGNVNLKGPITPSESLSVA